MSGHGPVCPCCRPGGAGMGLLSGLVEGVAAAAVSVVLIAYRFVSGRLLCRARGPWDPTWSRWAPEPHPLAWAIPGVARPPRSSWGRRPGWHRQLARLAVLVVGVGVLVAPLLTAAVAAGAALGIAGTVLAQRVQWSPPIDYAAPGPFPPRAVSVLPRARRVDPYGQPVEVIDADVVDEHGSRL